ncbi:hypothetical protein ACWD4P_15150 [Kitasatospora sp. NPDC002543]
MTARGKGPDQDTVDQIVFRWQGNQGRRSAGLTAAAASCPRADAEEIGQEIAPFLRVDGAPFPSVVRTRLRGDRAALVQRWPTADLGGRPSTTAHVLVGAAAILTPRTCLGLCDWAWSGQEFAESAHGPQPPVRKSELEETAGPAWGAALDRLPDVREALTAATAALLRRPASRLSLRSDALPGWPERNRASVVIAGLARILNPWLNQAWTFATYDMTDRHDLLVTWVSDWSADGGHQQARYRVDPRRPEADRAHELAVRLVDLCLAGVADGRGGFGLADLMGRQESAGGRRPEERLRRIAHALDEAGARRAPIGPEQYGPRGTAEPHVSGGSREPGEPREVDEIHEIHERHERHEPFGTHEPVEPYASVEPRAPHEPADTADTAETGAFGEPVEEPEAEPESVYETADEELRLPAVPPPGPAALGLVRAALLDPAPDGPGIGELRDSVSRLTDREALGLLQEEDLPFRATNELLLHLARVRGGRSAGEAADLCAEVLRQRLYLFRVGPDNADDSHLSQRAAWLFSWAVSPHARDARHAEALDHWLTGLLTSGDDLEVDLLRRLVPPPGEESREGIPPDLPPALWQRLYHRPPPPPPAVPAQPTSPAPSAVPPAPPAVSAPPAPPTLPAPPTVQAPPHSQARSRPSDAQAPPAAPVRPEPPPAPVERAVAEVPAEAPGLPAPVRQEDPPPPQPPPAPAPVGPSPGPAYGPPQHRKPARDDDSGRIAVAFCVLLLVLTVVGVILVIRLI